MKRYIVNLATGVAGFRRHRRPPLHFRWLRISTRTRVAQPLRAVLLVGSDVRVSARHRLRRRTPVRLGNAARHRSDRRFRQPPRGLRGGRWGPGIGLRSRGRLAGFRAAGATEIIVRHMRADVSATADQSRTSCRSSDRWEIVGGATTGEDLARRHGRTSSRAIQGRHWVANFWGASKTRGRVQAGQRRRRIDCQ